MWKSLRIGALLAIAAVGALKLAQYEVAQSQMQRVAGALAPKARLTYGTVTGALDGRVVLESPRLEITAGPAKGAVLRATRATFEPSSTLWLIARALGGDSSPPASLDVRLEGASFSEPAIDRYADDGWFGPVSLVPFESVGCDPVSHFSARDFARMGVAQRPREDALHYSFDANAHTLHAEIESTAPPFSTISARFDLSSFAPAAWFGDARAASAMRIEQLSLTYLDGGYLAQRNRFCAQLTGTDAAGYADRHLAAVKAFLARHGVSAGEDVAALYRKLVVEGGSAELSSLPEPSFVPADFAAHAPEDVLRQLNVTVRHDTQPPILMRLAFAEPNATPEITPILSDDASILTETSVPQETQPAESDASLLADATEIGPPAPEKTNAATPEPAASEGMPLLSVANAAPLPIETPRLALPVEPDVVDSAPTSEPTASVWTEHPLVDPRDAAEGIPASAPPPDPNSTAALVWRAPTIERLPQRVAQLSEYVSIPPGTLAANIGRRVRLVTAGGKLVEGRLQQLDGPDAVVLILRDGGSAQMRIPQAGIRDVMVRRPLSP